MRPTPGATSAARAYLRAHLGWLRGFPIREGKGGFTWQTVPGLGVEEQPKTIEVDRERVRKSVFAINRVQAKFPKAFVQVVDDADEWRRCMAWRIAHFKSVIHDGNALPSLSDLLDALNVRSASVKRVATLTERTALAGLIEALAWVCLQDQVKLEPRLSIIEDNAVAFEVLVKNDSLILALNLIDFLCEGVGQKLLTLLGDADVWTTPTSTLGHIGKLREYLSTFRATGALGGRFAVDGLALPSADSAGNLVDFLKRTTSMSAGHRRLRMSLLEAQIDPGLTGLWQKWWHDINLLEGDMRRALSGEMPFKARRSVVKTYRQKLQQCEECAPQLGYTLSAAENAAILADHDTLAHELLALSAELALPPAQFHALASAWKLELPLTFSSRVIREVIAGLRLLLPKLPSEGRTTASILESVVLDVAEYWVTGTKPVVLLKPWFATTIAWIEEDPRQRLATC